LKAATENTGNHAGRAFIKPATKVRHERERERKRERESAGEKYYYVAKRLAGRKAIMRKCFDILSVNQLPAPAGNPSLT
jgi:hypothetical protein